MARIEFVADVHREGACGTWSAILLRDGRRCAAMRLPVAASDRATVDRVLAATRKLMRAGVPGIAPIADVAVGGDQVWVFVGIAPGPSVADLLDEASLTPTDVALIALDAGRTLVDLHDHGLRHGAFGLRTVVVSRSGSVRVTEAGLAPALEDVESAPTVAIRVGSGLVGGGGGAAPPNTYSSSTNGTGPHAQRNGANPVGSPMSRSGDTRDDVEAWLASVRRLCEHLRALRFSAQADALEMRAEIAHNAGLAAALDAVAGAARGFGGYPSRLGLQGVMRRYDIDDEPDPEVVLAAIDALFDADASAIGPSRRPAPPPGQNADAAMADGADRALTDTADQPTVAIQPHRGFDERAAEKGTRDAAAPVLSADTSTDKHSDRTISPSRSPSRPPRKTSAIPLRRPANDAPAPSGLWVPRVPAPAGKTAVRPGGSVEEEPQPTDRTVRVGRGVPASNARRPTPARLGRSTWWARLAVNVALAVAIVAGVGAFVWWRTDRPLHVTAVSLTVQKHFAAACQLEADVVGTVITSGGDGMFSYQWRRSDGTSTAVYTARIADPAKPTEVHLTWTFAGSGKETAQVTLIVLTPQRREASTSFEYICAG